VHQTERAREGREETAQQIVVEVGQRWRALKDSAALLEAMRLEQEATAASLDTDQNRYRENAALLRDVLRTEARLSAARRDFTEALAGYWSAVALLERAIGDES
jgi:outer membrane protein TolC